MEMQIIINLSTVKGLFIKFFYFKEEEGKKKRPAESFGIAYHRPEAGGRGPKERMGASHHLDGFA